MLKNSATTAYGAKGLRSSKWLLLLCAASAAAVDIVIIAMLVAGGEAGEYLACPVLLLIFDAIYLALSLFVTNFRFRYSVGVWVSYIVLYTVGISIGNAIILGGEGTVITNTALALWECVHVFNIVCAVICALSASRVIKKRWLTFAVAAMFIAVAAVYAGLTLSSGFFGQGVFGRTVVYSYDEETDSYTAHDVLSGRSGRVEVPDTFNGKPVNAIHCQLFTRPNLTEVNLGGNLKIVGKEALTYESDLSELKINVDKKYVNGFRNSLFAMGGANGNEALTANAIALANATLPSNLDANEGYVAFNYEPASFDAANGNTIPVYVGDLKKFDFAQHAAGFAYAWHIEDGSAFNYDWAYKNGGYILSDTGLSEGVTKSTVADVKFKRVYRVNVDGGNDAKYDLREKQPDLCFDKVGGQRLPYKYLTKETASTFLDGLTPRKGFTYRWKRYKTATATGAQYIVDLPAEIEDDATLSVEWELKKPTVSVNVLKENGGAAENNTVTYGENVSFSADVELEAGVALGYTWYDPDSYLLPEWNRSLTLTAPKVAQSGEYLLRVTAGDDANTSLTASTECRFNLKINRKQVAFDWHLPENRVYDGSMKSVSVSFDESQQVAGNPVDYTYSGLSAVKDAGTYNFRVIATAATEANYEITNPLIGLTIAPCPVEVSWGNFSDLTYNGSMQAPTATATGVGSDGVLSVNVSGGSRNAGDHTARASVSDTNYTLTNPARTYTIKKAPLTVTPDPVTFTYGSMPASAPDVHYEGFVVGDTISSLGGSLTAVYAGTAAGTYEAADNGVRIGGYTSNNYEITYVNSKLTILPREVELSWSGISNLTYDATPKNVTATVTNRVGSDDIGVLVRGGTETNAGSYTATAYQLTGAAKGNYSLTETPYLYTIAKARLTIRPADKKSEYGDEIVPLTATVGTVYGNDEIGYELVKAEGDNAGTYAITVNVTKENSNYEVAAGSGTYTITKRVAYVLWLTESQRNHIYDGTEYSVFTYADYSYRGFLEKDIPYVTVTDYKATEAGDYVARVNLDSSIAGNYNLAAPECEWKIEKTRVHFTVYINGKRQSGDELQAVVGNAFTWSFANSQGKEISPQCNVTVKHGQSTVRVSGDGYTFADAGEYEITITSNDNNCIESTKTWKVTVDLVPSVITLDTVRQGQLAANADEITVTLGDTLRWSCNNTEGKFEGYCTYRALNAEVGSETTRHVDGDSFMFVETGVYNFTFTVGETAVYGAKTVTLRVTVNAD